MFPRANVLAKEFSMVLRGLRRDRIYAVASILLLAVGIGLSSAVFTLLWQAVYANLPVHDPGRLYTLATNVTHMGRSETDAHAGTFSMPTYRFLVPRFSAASGVIARHGEWVNVDSPAGPQHLLTDFVSCNFFPTLGLRPVLGRAILASDDAMTDARFTAVLSYAFWQEAFGGQLGALRASIHINGVPFRIVGIAPKNFAGLVSGQVARLYVPLSAFDAVNPGWHQFDDWSFRWLNLFARLRDGVPQQQAEACMQPVYRASVREELAAQPAQSPGYLQELEHERLSLAPASQGIHAVLDQWRQPLRILQWMTFAVLLLTALNVAGLGVVRAVKQRREVLVRYALGARRGDLMRLHFIETLTLAAAGGFAALWISRVSAGLLIHLAGMERGGATASAGAPSFAFLCIASVGAGLFVGLFPALYAARISLAAGLNEAGSHSMAVSQVFSRRSLAAAQTALSLVLVITAALFAKSLHTLVSTPVGFNADHLALFSIDPKISGNTIAATELLYERIASNIRYLPGVSSVSYGTGGPFPQGMDVALIAPAGNINGPRQRSGSRSVIGPNYFRTLGVPLLSGREFDQRDRAGAPAGLIINDGLAKKLFGTKNPIGQSVAMFNGVDPNWMATIIGVVADFHQSWKRASGSLIYTSAQQLQRVSDITFYFRTSFGAALTEQQIRALVQREMPGLSAYDVGTMPARMSEFASGDRAMTILTVLFAIVAFVIAVIGIYGVVTYTSSLRTIEFGVRISVGATPANIIGLIVREAALIVAGGLLLAVPLAWAGLHLIRSQLYGITADQPLIFAGAALLLAASGTAAALLPAVQSTRINVQEALRHS